MTDHVTPSTAALSKVNDPDPSVTFAEDAKARKREQAAARQRRKRAANNQAKAIEFIRTDASLFLDPNRISQKAGTRKEHVRRMAIKELVDNALDAADNVTLTEIGLDTFVVTDDGPGIEPEKAVRLFSVTRDMISSKLIRRPTRGAVGNGLRVVTGAAFASGGSLVVASRGISQELSFDPATGDTIVAVRQESTVTTGTRVTINFGHALNQDFHATAWGDLAIKLAGKAAAPMLTHPRWYSPDSFREVIRAANGSAEALASWFGVDLRHALARASEQGQFIGGQRDIDPDGPPDQLSLAVLHELAPAEPKLIAIADNAFDAAYSKKVSTAVVAGAQVPVIAQAWAVHNGKGNHVDTTLIVNRTPTVAELSVRVGGDGYIYGSGLNHGINKIAKGNYLLYLAITTPAVALINDGKTPDLAPYADAICDVVGKALRKCHQPKKRGTWSQKDAAYHVMPEAYLKASAGGTLPANARQIMYVARPLIQEMTGCLVSDSYFTQTLLPDFIEEHPEITATWDVVYDARGHMWEPHTGHSLPLGTLKVRDYLRRVVQPTSFISAAEGLHPTKGPGDRYNTVLFLEKEGFEPLLMAAKIAERFDLAVMSTKGMTVTAARQLVDRLCQDGVKILVAHDLDVAGIRIFGTFGADGRRYKYEESPDIHRLGLTLSQAREMKLQSEIQEFTADKQTVISGLRAYGVATEEELEFLASERRIELNAMTSDQFIRWLERCLYAHAEKVIPSQETIEDRARHLIGLQHVRDDVEKLEKQAKEFAAKADLPADLAEKIRRELDGDPELPWDVALTRIINPEGETPHGSWPSIRTDQR